jgi:hypothetical protein
VTTIKALVAAIAVVMTASIATPSNAEPICRVADPTPTPLNVRTSPNGRIVGTLRNGDEITVLDRTMDRKRQGWVYVGRSEDRSPIGWVYREYIDCHSTDPTPTASGQTGCRVTDPTPTPLNVRTTPNGRIVGTLDNNVLVSVLDRSVDDRGRSWVYVGRSEDRSPIGWVYREYIDCPEPHVKVINDFTCTGKLGPYSAGIADRSIGGGDSMCYFVSQSAVGRSILNTCTVGSNCRVVGTVKNDQDGGDWSPIITDIVSVRKQR